MSALDWRGVLARALYVADSPNEALETVQRQSPTRAVPWEYAHRADAILAAITARGYRLHRDHDMKVTPRGAVATGLQCTRCGHWDTDLGMPTMSCEDRA